ncbi:hypothetical protein J14TS2_21630 [Bacillus sp. J14TS2]|nr:hypothetical protein J14TS2_21630 [Bacillus sp. J14TS2]
MVTTPYSLITIRLVTLKAPHADRLHVFLPRNKMLVVPLLEVFNLNNVL